MLTFNGLYGVISQKIVDFCAIKICSVLLCYLHQVYKISTLKRKRVSASIFMSESAEWISIKFGTHGNADKVTIDLQLKVCT
jgi:hypothetical protein